MFAYTVALEEPGGPRSYPRLGKTNPNIVLDNEDFDGGNDNSSVDVPETEEQQQQQRAMFTADRSPDKEKQEQNQSERNEKLEEPDGPRGYPRLGNTNPTTLLDSEGSNGKDDGIAY
jgi:hypothetical protein